MPVYKTGRKKDGISQYRVFVNYTDANGKYRQKTKLVYGAAEAKLAELALQSDTKKEPSHIMTVQKLYDEYFETKKHEVRESTYSKSMRTVNLYVIPYLGNKNLNKLTTKSLQEWKNTIANTQLAIRSKQNVYKEFHAMLQYAVKLEYIPKNPLNSLGNFKSTDFQTPEDTIHYYTSKQFLAYIAEARNSCKSLNDWGCYVFFNIAFYTGMRKGEINALKWSDIDGDIIHVRRSVAQKIKGVPITETPPKNKSSYRTLQAPAPLVKVLTEHRTRLSAVKGFTDDWRVCGGVSCLSDTNIELHNKKYALNAELPHIRIHDFRHSHASLLANNGINIQEIARRLGHADIKMTWNTYSHLYPKEEERAIEILNKIK